jgi:hypothetical protein
VHQVRQTAPSAGLITDPEASNIASRRVLEKNGFRLLDLRRMTFEHSAAPMAGYRLPPPGEAGLTSPGGAADGVIAGRANVPFSG